MATSDEFTTDAAIPAPRAASAKTPPKRKQATPVELAALMMEAVCAPASSERQTLHDLAEFLGVDRGNVELELMFLCAFAVDFASFMVLGDAPERAAITDRFYSHWETISDGAGTDVLDDLRDRMRYYNDVVIAPDDAHQGLAGQVGCAFAGCCRASTDGSQDDTGQEELGEEYQELAMLGASMFAALFDEVSEMLSGLDILLYES